MCSGGSTKSWLAATASATVSESQSRDQALHTLSRNPVASLENQTKSGSTHRNNTFLWRSALAWSSAWPVSPERRLEGVQRAMAALARSRRDTTQGYLQPGRRETIGEDTPVCRFGGLVGGPKARGVKPSQWVQFEGG